MDLAPRRRGLGLELRLGGLRASPSPSCPGVLYSEQSKDLCPEGSVLQWRQCPVAIEQKTAQGTERVGLRKSDLMKERAC